MKSKANSPYNNPQKKSFTLFTRNMPIVNSLTNFFNNINKYNLAIVSINFCQSILIILSPFSVKYFKVDPFQKFSLSFLFEK